MVSSSCTFSHPKLEWIHKLSLQEFWKAATTRNKFAVVLLFYTFHSFPFSMELLGSMIPTSHRATIKYFNTGNCLWFLNSKNCATMQASSHRNCSREKKQVSARKLQCIFNSCECYSIIFYMSKNIKQ